jgi:hypothetical protein
MDQIARMPEILKYDYGTFKSLLTHILQKSECDLGKNI